ncbi:MAG: pilus assembly protein [Pseudomonadota bacterium]
MRVLFSNFKKSEDGASLVEYAVALIVVTIIGGAGVIALGQNAGGVTEAACDTTATALAAVDPDAAAAGCDGVPGAD